MSLFVDAIGLPTRFMVYVIGRDGLGFFRRSNILMRRGVKAANMLSRKLGKMLACCLSALDLDNRLGYPLASLL